MKNTIISKFMRPDIQILSGNTPVDQNDPIHSGDAFELSVPTSFSIKAKAMMEYLEGSAFIFAYKGQLVMTDESMYLTTYVGSNSAIPSGCPQMICNSWEEMEQRLEKQYECL